MSDLVDKNAISKQSKFSACSQSFESKIETLNLNSNWQFDNDHNYDQESWSRLKLD